MWLYDEEEGKEIREQAEREADITLLKCFAVVIVIFAIGGTLLFILNKAMTPNDTPASQTTRN